MSGSALNAIATARHMAGSQPGSWLITPKEIAAIVAVLEQRDELLAALKAVVAVLQKEAPGTPLNNHHFDALGIQAHNAIAKAEGR
jgi:hypothetical protein